MIFLFLGVALHGDLRRYVDAIGEAAGGAAGILLQFPFYAGIMGLMVAKNADKYTEYFKKMGDNLVEQKKAVLEEIASLSAEIKKLTPGTEEYDKKYSDLNERQADLIDIEKKIANLRDEEIEDEISRLNNREASVEALIE